MFQVDPLTAGSYDDYIVIVSDMQNDCDLDYLLTEHKRAFLRPTFMGEKIGTTHQYRNAIVILVPKDRTETLGVITLPFPSLRPKPGAEEKLFTRIQESENDDYFIIYELLEYLVDKCGYNNDNNLVILKNHVQKGLIEEIDVTDIGD